MATLWQKLVSKWSKKKKKVEPIHIVPLEKIEFWLTEQSSFILQNSNIHTTLLFYQEKASSKRWLIETKLDEWQELIPDTQKEEVEPIFSRIQDLFDTLPTEWTIRTISSFISSFEKNLDTIIETVEASQFAHNYGFISQSSINPLLQELINFHSLIRTVETKVAKSGYRSFIALEQKNNIIQSHLAKIEELFTVLSERKEQRMLTEHKRLEKYQELEKLQSDPQFEVMQRIRQHHEKTKEEIRVVSNKIEGFFNILHPVLEQYVDKQLIDHKPTLDLVNQYLFEPYEALLSDDSLSISHILRHIQALLRTRQFKIELSESSNILDTIVKVNLNYLQQHAISLQRSRLRVEPEHVQFVGEYEDVVYRMDHFDQQLEKIEDDITHLNDKVQYHKDAIEQEKQLFISLARIGLGREVRIT